MNVKFEVIGEPVAKSRPKFTKVGSFVQTYTPKKTTNYENLVKLSYQNQVDFRFGDDEYLKVIIKAYFSIPSSASNKRKFMMDQGVYRPAKTPDCDNVAKIILDSLNDIAYKDDKQVVELVVSKYYSNNPRVEVSIGEID